jgi:hypothetical protein
MPHEGEKGIVMQILIGILASAQQVQDPLNRK